MFFVLSGRLMAEILFIERYDLRRFYIKRLGRVWPTLFVFVVCCWTVIKWPGLTVHAKSALAALTFTYNYAQVLFQQRAGALDHIWSLCVEEHAYVLLGALALACRRFQLSALTFLVIAALFGFCDGLVSTMVFHQGFFDTYWRTDVHAASIFCAGAVYLLVRARSSAGPLMGWASVISGVAGIAVFALRLPNSIEFTIGTALLAFSVSAIDQAPAAFRTVLSLRPLTWLGLVSFSVYLWQQLFYKGSFGAEVWVRTCALLAAVIVGAASYYLVETPSRRFISRRFAS